MQLVIVQGYGKQVLIFSDPDNAHSAALPIWRQGKIHDFRFHPGYKRIRTKTPAGTFNAGEIKRFFRISPKLKKPYDYAIVEDKGLFLPQKRAPKLKRNRKRARRG